MESILVTGANGFIGHYVTERLTAGGYAVYSIDREAYRYEDNMVTSFTLDMSDYPHSLDCVKELNNTRALIHLAADITIPGNKTTLGNNISSMLSAIEIAKRANIKHFILLSSIPVVGKIEYTPIDEDHPVHPETMYHWSKYLCERILEDHARLFDAITIVRIPSPIGIGMGSSTFLSLMIKKMMQGECFEVYGNGQRMQNYIDVRDIAEALLMITQSGVAGLYLLAGEKSISNIDVAELCQRIINPNIKIIKGLHPDPEEYSRWIIACNKAKEKFGFVAQYELESSIRWIYEGIK